VYPDRTSPRGARELGEGINRMSAVRERGLTGSVCAHSAMRWSFQLARAVSSSRVAVGLPGSRL